MYQEKNDIIPNIHFLHIRKTGGTAIKEALKNKTYKYTVQLHGHNFKLEDVPCGEKVFFFLRDPATRFVSGFYSRFRQGRPRYNCLWNEQEKIAFSHFSTANDLAESIYSDSSKIRSDALFAMKNISHIKDSYYYWFKNKEYFQKRIKDIIYIGFQENLNNDFRQITKILQLPKAVALPTDDVLTHKLNISTRMPAVFEVALPTDDVLTHKTPEYYDTRLSKQAIKNLHLWYKEDYAFVWLCKQKACIINVNQRILSHIV